MKEIKLLFYRTAPSEENTGLKQVLYKITTQTVTYSPDPAAVTNPTSEETIYDYGYCDWDGREWCLPEVPDNVTIEVHSWANNPDPKWLLDESKIIRI